MKREKISTHAILSSILIRMYISTIVPVPILCTHIYTCVYVDTCAHVPPLTLDLELRGHRAHFVSTFNTKHSAVKVVNYQCLSNPSVSISINLGAMD